MLDVNSPDKWEKDYANGGDGWDLHSPTPVFQRLLREKRFAPGKMLVLGAGRGHDAREFARGGFDVTAVDFTKYAAREMARLATPDAPVEILRADIFQLPRALDGAFDYVLEYTCFCAIDPRRRAEYAAVVARVLRPFGIYIDLAYPLDAPSPLLRTQGPPFSVSVPENLGLMSARGLKLVERSRPADSVKPRLAREELLIFRKEQADASP